MTICKTFLNVLLPFTTHPFSSFPLSLLLADRRSLIRASIFLRAHVLSPAAPMILADALLSSCLLISPTHRPCFLTIDRRLLPLCYRVLYILLPTTVVVKDPILTQKQVQVLSCLMFIEKTCNVVVVVPLTGRGVGMRPN